MRTRLWPIVVVVLVSLIGCGGIPPLLSDRDAPATPTSRPQWSPPEQLRLSAAVETQPVPGWHTTTADLLSSDASSGPTPTAQFTTDTDPLWSQPFVGNVGDNAYFVLRAGDGNGRWWLAGVDVRDGHGLFPAVPIESPVAPKCLLNGPVRVLCLSSGSPRTAWVVDTQSGTVKYHGPTDITTATGHLGAQQVGIYALAGKMGQGLFGIGDTAETTWFVPGDGSALLGDGGTPDFAPLPLAMQSIGGAGSDRVVVFSPADGKVVVPEMEDGLYLQSAAIYPGGFAFEVASHASAPIPDAVMFFDMAGKPIRRVEIPGFLERSTENLPILSSRGRSFLYSAQGFPLAEISEHDGVLGALMMESRLFVNQSYNGVDEWQEYDLRTGQKGQVCGTNLSGYVGMDGETAVVNSGSPAIGLQSRGVDIATCTQRWSYTSAPGSFRNLWRINTTLVQLSDDGTELMSLVAP